MLTGAIGLQAGVPPAIERAMAISPDQGTTFEDAEHVVFLMQENRSFDHCFGTLQGVRGFNDPRAITQPNKLPVWAQSSRKGQTYLPFRLDIHDSKATWMGDLPHSWPDQVDARNDGKHNRWLDAKQSRVAEYRDMPLTMGHYTREDIPFYYALADAFTVCDQHFCSSLTGTTSNRLFFWSGKLREHSRSKALIQNSDVGYNRTVDWTTFPERLEQHGVSWRIYQNEISHQNGLVGEEASLLANFTDNNLEWFSQYHVGFSRSYQIALKKRQLMLTRKIEQLKAKLAKQPASEADTKFKRMNAQLSEALVQWKHNEQEAKTWSRENFAKLPLREQNLHEKAFTTNHKDPHYHQIETLRYDDNGVPRSVRVPKGDILHQFREDVNEGKLPTVTWLVAPQKFSDHPSSPWYGAWYVSEVLDILTKNPEIWKKTIFVLNYDENDGYFDHVAPFVAPHPAEKNAVSKGIDTTEEFVDLENKANLRSNARQSPVGLGYRVPLVIASPWSKGGWVNSEVCDLTSTLRFLEKFLSKKTGKSIKESNISDWRRTVCGDLTSVFRPYHGEPTTFPETLDRDTLIGQVYNSSFKGLPNAFKPLSEAQIEQAKAQVDPLPMMPQQEPGIRDSCPLSYELYTNGKLNSRAATFEIEFAAGNNFFSESALGSPFQVCVPVNYQQKNSPSENKFESFQTWPVAVRAGDSILMKWPLNHFENNEYQLRIDGPNGFFREFKGNPKDPDIIVRCGYQTLDPAKRKPSGNIELAIANHAKNESWKVVISDQAYGNKPISVDVAPGTTETVAVSTTQSHGWYDFSIQVRGAYSFHQRYAGRVETGHASKTDPLMGRVRATL